MKELLLAHRFVAIAGTSGSGKTSLIQSGIIPDLINDEKEDWVPISVRPGNKPLESLIRGFQKVFPNKITEPDVQAFLTGAGGLSELILDKGLSSLRYFLVVDQFEELFRSDPATRKKKKNGKHPEARRFVDLLVDAIQKDEPEFSVMISVRSDYLDDCSLLRPLTELMNKSKYMIPQMTRESLSRAIMGPIQQAGFRVEPGFLDHLLEDLEEVEVPLPRMQHALMRTWDHWAQQGDLERPISLADYHAIGSLRNALSDHLEEAYGELDPGQKAIGERLFKTITSKTDHHEGCLRQTTVATIARIAQCNVEEVIDIVEVFRKPGRSFIAPHSAVSLRAETRIEIAHESLITIWDRLGNWVDEEAQSVQMYLRLSEASALYQQGRTELWKPPELQLALAWRDSQQPTPAWGVQYNPAFERAMVFLSTSEEEHQWQEERKVVLQRRRLIFNRALAVFMGTLLVVIAVVFFTLRNRPGKPDRQESGQDYTYIPDPRPSASGQPSREPPSQAPDQTLDAGEAESSIGDEQMLAGGEMDETSAEPVNRQPITEAAPATPVVRGGDSGDSRSEVRPTPRRTEREEPLPASSGTTPSGVSGQQAIATARQVAQLSVEVSRNPDLQALLAYQAYQLNREYNGNSFDIHIYQGLYQAMKKLISPAFNIYPNIRNTVKSLAWLDRTGSFLASGSDGSIKILSGNIADRASQIDLTNTGLPNEALSVSPDERMAAVGTNGGGILFLELENRGEVLHRSTEEGNIILFLENLGNSGNFISAGTENRIVMWNYSSRERRLLVTTSSRPSALAGSPNGRSAAVGTRDGVLIEFNVSDPAASREIQNFGRNHVLSLAYGPGGSILVAGLLDGSLKVMSGANRRVIATLRGPGARVTDVAISPDGRFLAAASHDGNVYLWNTSDWTSQPISFQENNGFVLSVCFSGNSHYFYSGSVDYPRLVGRPSEAAQMAGDFCSLLGRNLTLAEWEEYFGGDIPYEKTCPGLN